MGYETDNLRYFIYLDVEGVERKDDSTTAVLQVPFRQLSTARVEAAGLYLRPDQSGTREAEIIRMEMELAKKQMNEAEEKRVKEELKNKKIEEEARKRIEMEQLEKQIQEENQRRLMEFFLSDDSSNMSDDVSEKFKNNKKSKKRRNSDPDWEPSGTKKKRK